MIAEKIKSGQIMYALLPNNKNKLEIVKLEAMETVEKDGVIPISQQMILCFIANKQTRFKSIYITLHRSQLFHIKKEIRKIYT